MKKDTGIRVKYGVPYFIVRVMAIGMLFLILNTSNILAATESPVVLDLSLNQTTLEQVFRELEKQSGYSIIYKSSEVNLKEVLSVDVSKEPLENVLNKVLRKFCVRGKNLIHLTAYVYEKCLLLQGEDRTFYKKTATSYIGWLPSFSELFFWGKK